MANEWIASFAVALGFEVNKASETAAKKSVADYERAVREAEKRIEDARWEGAKTEEEIAKLTRETRLKEARASLAEAQEREKSEKETARKREERHKEFIAGWNKAALAATAAATAISYAVGRVASAFDNLGFVSQRTGASVQSLNSLGYAFKQTGGSAQQAIGAVEKFAQAMRTNPGLKGFVQQLGVNTSKDMGDQYLDTVAALAREPYVVGHQHAGMLGISEEDFKLVSDHLQQIREYRTEYNRTTQSLGVDSQKATEASQSFWRSLTKLQATASALSDKLMVSLAPALEAIVRRFNDWVAAHPEQVQKILDDITKGLVLIATKFAEFTDWMVGEGGNELIKRWDDFAKRVERVAKGIETISKVAGFLLGNSGVREYGGVHGDASRTAVILNDMTAQRYAGEAESPGLFRRGVNAVRRAFGGGSAAAAQGGNDTAPQTFSGVPPTSDANSLTALYEREARRAGIDVRIMHGIRRGESGHRNNYDVVDNARESSWGPFQLNRRRGLGVQFEKETGLDVRDPRTIPAQVRWVAEGLKKNGRRWLSNWMGYRGDADADPRWGNSGYRPVHTPPPVPAPTSLRTPGNFDPNHIDPANLMQPAPSAASPTTNNNTNSRSVSQNITNNVNVQTAGDPRTASRLMEGTLGRVHSLALANAQSAVV
ncbi:hypothetical protein [Methylobacterium sp. J-067]|uniref:hypothetical protein n=1 Tax=Methylobacterium sp. J-067 TaxID=2836648 RepID=UPI001FBB2AF0|nr:hypothetical protein [Methylobacterium sp. J-067]MCJ2023669.1 hypothetical protein [Methylobacterium sp. J-067]